VQEVPQGCEELFDADAGISTIVCEKEQRICPTRDPSWEQKCIEQGGLPEYHIGPDTCEFLKCSFEDENKTARLWENKAECQTIEQNNEDVLRCKEFGGSPKYVKKNGCERVVCERKETDKCVGVDSLSPNIVQEIKTKCNSQGLQVVRDYNTHGCEILACGAKEQYCKSVPAEAYTQCKGELIVEKDAKGCVTFVECVAKGDAMVSLEAHEKLEEVPDSAILLGMVFKLEDLKIRFVELGEKIQAIAAFYQERNDTNGARFERASEMLFTAADEVEDILNFLRDTIESLSVQDIEDVKLKIRHLRKSTLKNVLYIMLSSSEEVRDITQGNVADCGFDEDCFDAAFRLCKQATFTPEDGVEAEIRGLENGMCSMYVTDNNQDMTCSIPHYSSGIEDPQVDILPYCEGPLVAVLA